MSRFQLNVYLVLAAPITFIYILFYVDDVWSQSIDLAHHYSLAFRISEKWTLLSGADPTLGEMNIYPRGSHYIAAIVGKFVNSTFLGIQLTALFSISILWINAIYILKNLPEPTKVNALAVALSLVFMNYFIFGFQLHGHEIVGNFFFAQLVGQAFLFFCLVLAIAVEKRKGALWASISLIPLMLIIATINLLPALEVLGLIVGLVATFVFTERKNSHAGLAIYFYCAVILVFAISCIVLHPSFSAMLVIADNNGSLELNNINFPFGLISLCFLIFSTSIILFILWFRKSGDCAYLVAKHLSIYGLATVGLCLLQYVLTYFGTGSDYAVKKYVFGLVTILLLQFSLIMAMLIVDFTRVRFVLNKNNFLYSSSILEFFLLISLLFLNTPSAKSLDVSDLVLLERKLTTLTDTTVPSSEDGKPVIIIGLEKFSRTVNYMFSIAISKTPRELAIADVLLRNEVSQPSNYSYIISSNSNINFNSIDCTSLSSGNISIVKSECLGARSMKASKCKGVFDFTLAGFIPEQLLKGFSVAETHGRWTDGSTAIFKCYSDGLVFTKAKIELAPFTHDFLNFQRILLFVNEEIVYQGNISTMDSNNLLIVDLTSVPSLDSYTFKFEMPDAVSPKEVGLNEDVRKLGFNLRNIILY